MLLFRNTHPNTNPPSGSPMPVFLPCPHCNSIAEFHPARPLPADGIRCSDCGGDLRDVGHSLDEALRRYVDSAPGFPEKPRRPN